GSGDGAATSGDAQTGEPTAETIQITERPSKHETHAVEAQVQFALLILIILSVLFIIFARIDDWFKYRR
ncbi:MAG: hypothetical protein KAH44_25825, partial [Oricola sp.]|nr:hypothetical protein [Oricola sp.]